MMRIIRSALLCATCFFALASGAASQERASLEDELASLPLVQTLDTADALKRRNSLSNDTAIPESERTSNGATTEDFDVQPVAREEMPLSVAYKELDIPGAHRPSVQKYRDYYLSEKSVKWLSSVLENGEQYRLYVREKLKERGMPSVLEYLPVVESGYTTNAKSKSGAVGLWQFMANSTKPFLVRNDFVDERLDPWKSTDAALAKLEENFNMFHDWPLAIAAYNCGAGAMARALAKNPGKDFWYLAEHKQLRDQTAQYVPKLLAVADAAENAAYYAVALPSAKDEKGEPVNPRAGRFDYAETKGSISVRRLAHELKIDEDTLSSLNSALFRGITPPADVWHIRVPEGMARSAQDAIAAIEPYRFQMRYTVHEGDSLWGIAKRFGTTVDALCDTNNVKSNAVLRIGKILYIPVK
ncbi:lytic transglycosylase domain-containing protein [Treponema sp. Marseille-Q4130]|uniref:lytic transglycosylase domain-containing protein n=1 Tax=Treponema sp. Marseille-Q4130 TaxID=2766702 RepID=UPI001652AC0E|nr:lytic transglycosylase domain-containing protein [Treponema sp. Marseille-Q4130]MBC6720400.1 transglycosylase SLT domain-containing protein [Treponema sp. Marseille-Q4130]